MKVSNVYTKGGRPVNRAALRGVSFKRSKDKPTGLPDAGLMLKLRKQRRPWWKKHPSIRLKRKDTPT
jgi:hypothetical protein